MQPFKQKLWLSSPTMHGDELKYMTEAYETNWMSTVGKNINEIERIVAEKLSCGYAVALASGTSALHLAVKGYCVANRYVCEFVRFELFTDYYKHYSGEVGGLFGCMGCF